MDEPVPLVDEPGHLSPTVRTRITRQPDLASTDRSALRVVLDEAYVCHLGVVVDGTPRVVPTICAPDWDGADPAGTLYVHGSVAATSLVAAPDQTVCVTVTLVDGLMLARSGFEHSVAYRSATVYAVPRPVTDRVEVLRALDLLVDHVVPGRAATLRPHTRKELAATRVLALSLAEASVKVSEGDPEDLPADVAAGTWAGRLPTRTVADPPRTAADVPPGTPVPGDVLALARRLAAPRPEPG
jgi:nitroimidazol reductase NimA-like FMN-containing flavoprotein (pyridoxamine 5'-phosphate oxidase superfamily)